MIAEPIALFGSARLLFSKPEPNGEDTPILLVHGLYHNRTAWWLFERRLRHAGFTNVHTFQYNSFTRDFGTALCGMERKMEELLGDDLTNRVILIGHSLGGLVCRVTAGRYQYRDRVAGLITLGSPHKGSDLAYLGGNRMARDLMPRRYIPKRVKESPDPNCSRLGIYTLTDDYVFPLESLRTGREGWQERICSPMGHIWMLYSTEVTDMALGFLQELKMERQAPTPLPRRSR